MNRNEYKRLSDLEKLKMAIHNVRSINSSIRPHTLEGTPGGLIEFSEEDKREFIIIGDLHGNKKNLKAILSDSENLYKIKNNEAVIIFLGDIIHDDRTGHLLEMESSIAIMDIVIRLINEYPKNIIYLLGNHDTFSPYLIKGTVKQGLIYHKALLENKGEKYVALLQILFKSLPLFVSHPWFLAMHAGPVRGGITRDVLINIKKYEDFHRQLIWNRINETHSTPSKKEYSPEDLDTLRTLLKCPADIPVIVGHNPMWKWGTNDSYWINPLGTQSHVILYSNMPEKCPYISVTSSSGFNVKHADLKIRKKRFVLDND